MGALWIYLALEPNESRVPLSVRWGMTWCNEGGETVWGHVQYYIVFFVMLCFCAVHMRWGVCERAREHVWVSIRVRERARGGVSVWWDGHNPQPVRPNGEDGASLSSRILPLRHTQHDSGCACEGAHNFGKHQTNSFKGTNPNFTWLCTAHPDLPKQRPWSVNPAIDLPIQSRIRYRLNLMFK